MYDLYFLKALKDESPLCILHPSVLLLAPAQRVAVTLVAAEQLLRAQA